MHLKKKNIIYDMFDKMNRVQINYDITFRSCFNNKIVIFCYF